MASQNHALIFGASGVSGWAIASECLAVTKPASFARVTALTNRPLSLEDSMLPKDPRLVLASGVDLTKDAATVSKLLADKVLDVNTVTHVFFTAYIEKPDFPSLVQVNKTIFKNALDGLAQLSPSLRSVVLQTGGKHYGIEFADQVNITPPLLESAPRIPAPYRDNIFYYAQVDIGRAFAESHPGVSFTEVRPDVIIGFTPGSNFMNIAQGLGMYLSLRRAVDGPGAWVPFPGSAGGWKCRHTDSTADHMARIEIHAALSAPADGKPRAFNGTDGPVVTWERKWPALCTYFGLKGAPPPADAGDGVSLAGDWATKHSGDWHKLEKEHGLRPGLFDSVKWPFIGFVCGKFDFDREFDQAELRKSGFHDSMDTVKGFTNTFDRMRNAKVIP